MKEHQSSRNSKLSGEALIQEVVGKERVARGETGKASVVRCQGVENCAKELNEERSTGGKIP